MSEPEPASDEQMFAKAAQWFARMRGPDAQANQKAFDIWLAEDPRHRTAYSRAAEIFSMGKVLNRDRKSIWPNAKRRPVLAGIAAGILLAGAASWILLEEPFDDRARDLAAGQTGVAELATANERRRIVLADGSAIALAPASALRAVFSRNGRNLFLEAGSARFTVAHEARPFVVFAGGGSVTAKGTIFDVGLLRDRRVLVRLFEGSVDVELPAAKKASAHDASTRQLRPGETISFAAKNGVRTVEARNPASSVQATANGARDYRDVQLSEIVEEANRRSERKLQLAYPALGKKLVSGRFRTDNVDDLADRIAALFDLGIDRRQPDRILLHSK